MEKLNGFYTDENMNKWDMNYFREGDAITFSKFMVENNTYNCKNCMYCRECRQCEDCTQCVHCKHCEECTQCVDCRYSINCVNCSGLRHRAYLRNEKEEEMQ